MVQDEAYTFCNKLDSRARLMEIHLEEQMEYLRAIIDSEGEYYFWLGGTDRGLEGSWIWENSREPVADFVWYGDNPYLGIDGNCMYWYYPGGATGPSAAGDCHCLIERYPLCQIPL